MPIDTRHFRSALGSFATGVTIVTTRDLAGNDVGLTVNSFSSVSLDPPMVLWSLAKKSHSRQAFIDSACFAVHILAADQSELATRFASPVDRFQGLTLERGDNGLPLLQGCAARFQCRTVTRHEGGDHDIILGEVISYEHFERPALVFHAGRYALAVHKPDAAAANGKPADEYGRNSITQLLARAYYQLELAIRPELARCKLSETEYYILAAAALIGPGAVADLVAMVAVSGLEASRADVERLAERGLVARADGDHAAGTIQLTHEGRELVLGIAAVSKAAEADAITDLSYPEAEILKQMLRRIIRRTRGALRRDA